MGGEAALGGDVQSVSASQQPLRTVMLWVHRERKCASRVLTESHDRAGSAVNLAAAIIYYITYFIILYYH